MNDVPAYLVGLREARDATSLSQEDIAARAGVSKMTVYNILKGATMGTPDTVLRLVQVLLPTDPDRAARILADHKAVRDERYEARYGTPRERIDSHINTRTTDSRAALADAVNNLADAIRELARVSSNE